MTKVYGASDDLIEFENRVSGNGGMAPGQGGGASFVAGVRREAGRWDRGAEAPRAGRDAPVSG